MTSVTEQDIQNAINVAQKQEGKPYTQNIPARFGTSAFDCSGLVWYALTTSGVPMPGGPHDDAAAIVDPELQWAASQPGAQVITDESKVQAGDIVGFYASDATTHGSAVMDSDGNHLKLGNTDVASMGHIGIATSPTDYVSAYDTASGIIDKPIASDNFTAAVRLKPGNYSGQAPTGGGGGGGGSTPAATQCVGVSLFGHCFGATIPSISSLESDAVGILERAALFILGGILILVGIWILVSSSGKGPSMPSAGEVANKADLANTNRKANSVESKAPEIGQPGYSRHRQNVLKAQMANGEL